MQKFNAAKFILFFIITVGWLVIAIAILAFVVPITEVGFPGKLIGLIGGLFYGVTLIAIGQMGLAQIATAENTQKLVLLFEASLNGTLSSAGVGGVSSRTEPTISKPR